MPTWVGSSGYNLLTRSITDSSSPTKKLDVLCNKLQSSDGINGLSDVVLHGPYVIQELIIRTIHLAR